MKRPVAGASLEQPPVDWLVSHGYVTARDAERANRGWYYTGVPRYDSHAASEEYAYEQTTGRPAPNDPARSPRREQFSYNPRRKNYKGRAAEIAKLVAA